MSTKITINQAGIRELRLLPQVQTGLVEAAAAIAAAAYQAAPFKTGHYRDSIKVVAYPGDGVVKVVATDFKSNWIEFGTATGFPTWAPLRAGVASAGFRLVGGKGR